MGWSSVCKVLQKQTHDFLSHRHGTLVIVCGVILIVVSAFQFGEVALEWSTEKYAAVFNSFSDNIAGRSYRTRLCLPVPIDVVYTWVNGSDPTLLAELRQQKMMLEQELNETSTVTHSGQCTFSHCIKAQAVVLEPPIPDEITLIHLGFLYPSFKSAVSMQLTVNPGKKSANVSLIAFESQEQVDLALNTTVFMNGRNVSMRQVYYTSDWTLPYAVVLPETVMMTGFPHTMEREQLYNLIPSTLQKSITKFELHQDQGLVLMILSSEDDAETLLKERNITIEGKEPSLTSANFVWDLADYTLNEDVSANRFEDNEELRYSLRSIEQYAPWVRHVYIVTNGQIPGWLNLDSPRMTIVPHRDIFPNKTHLPTFSSPSIESHLHRIPGLSDKFIYLNDDVMFGKEVWPDDFFTHSRGQKVYLTWPVPNCQEGCPSSWILDGYCDKACNNSECEWDGGDCKGDAGNQAFGGDFGGGGYMGDQQTSESLYCNTGCANSWIADRYCDSACNVYPCGFDAGDCGTQAYKRLKGAVLDRNITAYTIPQGELVFYLNLSSLLGQNGTVDDASYNETKIIRSVALALKFKVMTFVFYNNMSMEKVEIHLKGRDASDQPFQLNATLIADTRLEPKPGPDIAEVDAKLNVSANATKPKIQFVFDEYPAEQRLPKAVTFETDPEVLPTPVNISLYELPADIEELWKQILLEYHAGDITEKGFQLKQGALWWTFVNMLKAEGKEPVRVRFTNHSDTGYNPLVNGRDHQQENDAPDKREYVKNLPVDVGLEAVFKNQDPDRVLERVVNQGEVIGFHGSKGDRQVVANLPSPVNHPMPDQGIVNMKVPDWRYVPNLGAAEFKVEDPVKQFLHNMSAKVHENKVNIQKDGGALDDHEALKLMPQGLMDQNLQHVIDSRHEQDINEDVEKPDKMNHDFQGDNIPNDEKFRSRKLNSLDKDDSFASNDDAGFLPWERLQEFKDLQHKQQAHNVQNSYQVAPVSGRRLLDTFGDSLRHVNKLYNKEFGYVARKVPAHMPHMIDRHIMKELHDRFPMEWDVTSSHKIRSSDDMQFSFSYLYFLMSEPDILTVRDVFNEMDLDKSGVLSDRELRTMATRLFEAPLALPTLTGLENTLKNCSDYAPIDLWAQTYTKEKYYDKDMPQVTRHLIENCTPVIGLFEKAYKARTKYKHEILGDEEVAFKMIRSNVSQVVGQLDDIRRHPRKFICLNDNIDHSLEAAKTVKAVLVDFYEAMYPIPSSFELPREYKNRFLHLDELNEWRKYRDWLKLWTQVALVFLILFTIASFFSDKIEALQKKYLGRRRTAPEARKEAPTAPRPPIQHV